jgi:hypothetical protein
MRNGHIGRIIQKKQPKWLSTNEKPVLAPLGGLQGGGPIQKNSPGNLTANGMRNGYIDWIIQKKQPKWLSTNEKPVLASPRGTTGWGTYPKKFAWKFDGE